MKKKFETIGCLITLLIAVALGAIFGWLVYQTAVWGGWSTKLASIAGIFAGVVLIISILGIIILPLINADIKSEEALGHK